MIFFKKLHLDMWYLVIIFLTLTYSSLEFLTLLNAKCNYKMVFGLSMIKKGHH